MTKNSLALWDAKGTTERDAMCVTLHAEAKPQKRAGERGFTLAEVLITLGIIGVVAALTIPTLMQKTNERETVSKVKKFVTVVTNAFQSAVQENGNISTWTDQSNTAESSSIVANYIKPFLNITNDCGLSCEDYPFQTMKSIKESSNVFLNLDDMYKLILTDGSVFFLRKLGSTVDVFYDTNGRKDPNVFGKDIFRVRVGNSGMFSPPGYGTNPAEGGNYSCNPNASGGDLGWFCTEWVFYKENLDYLHCADELTWNGKTKCD